ncbi:MAG TPA: lysophospholipid acyltransferase family protein [Candidatus Saccharimonadia bacterium]|jgi:1-acyl-sn-glycerol-3-phosphate acyltransferase|nr:lysophospholipid acyltransferase family protein [Candidatus Saccharimonadia bacterium]
MDIDTTAYSMSEPGIYGMHRYIAIAQLSVMAVGGFINFILLRHFKRQLKIADIEPGMRYVVASNHQTFLDPFVVPAFFSFRLWGKLGRPHTMVANRFFRNPIFGFYLRSVGCFPARVHATDPYGLDYARVHLDRGESVIIYPEGKLSRRRQNRAHNGIMVLAHQPNVRVIPVHIEWRRNRWGFYILDACVGKPFDARQMLAEEILEYIYSVPVD